MVFDDVIIVLPINEILLLDLSNDNLVFTVYINLDMVSFKDKVLNSIQDRSSNVSYDVQN